MASNIDFDYNDDDNTEIEAPSIGFIAKQNLDTRKSRRDQPKTPVKPPPPKVSAHGGGNIEDLSQLSYQANKNRDLAPGNKSRKRSHSDDESDLQKKLKVDVKWSYGKPQENLNESGVEAIIRQVNGFDPSNQTEQRVVTAFSQHSGSSALISYEIRNQIEQQVRATVASHFEALQTKMNNVEDKMKQLLEGVRKSYKTKKGLKGLIEKVLPKKDHDDIV